MRNSALKKLRLSLKFEIRAENKQLICIWNSKSLNSPTLNQNDFFCCCCCTAPTYIIAVFQEQFEIFLHVVMVHSHKEGIHYNAQGDEQFHKRIKDDDRTKLLKINPARTAVPNAADVYTLYTVRQTLFFELGFILFLLSVCWKIIDGHWIMFKYDRLVACGRGLSTLCWHTTHTTNYECHAQDKGG